MSRFELTEEKDMYVITDSETQEIVSRHLKTGFDQRRMQEILDKMNSDVNKALLSVEYKKLMRFKTPQEERELILTKISNMTQSIDG